jgi:hypothetical protein
LNYICRAISCGLTAVVFGIAVPSIAQDQYVFVQSTGSCKATALANSGQTPLIGSSTTNPISLIRKEGSKVLTISRQDLSVVQLWTLMGDPSVATKADMKAKLTKNITLPIKVKHAELHPKHTIVATASESQVFLSYAASVSRQIENFPLKLPDGIGEIVQIGFSPESPEGSYFVVWGKNAVIIYAVDLVDKVNFFPTETIILPGADGEKFENAKIAFNESSERLLLSTSKNAWRVRIDQTSEESLKAISVLSRASLRALQRQPNSEISCGGLSPTAKRFALGFSNGTIMTGITGRRDERIVFDLYAVVENLGRQLRSEARPPIVSISVSDGPERTLLVMTADGSSYVLAVPQFGSERQVRLLHKTQAQTISLEAFIYGSRPGYL